MPHDKIKAAARRRMAETGEPYAAARRAALSAHQDGASGGGGGNRLDAAQDPSAGTGPGLLMSDQIRGWLTGLRAGDPRTAVHVARALAGLLTEGAGPGNPLVSSTADSWPWALAEALDVAYQERLERLAAVRSGHDSAVSLVKDIQVHAMDLWHVKAGLEDRGRPAAPAGNGGPDEALALPTLVQRLQRQSAEVQRLLTRAVKARDALAGILQRAQDRTDAFRVRRETAKAAYIAAQSSLDVHQIMAGSNLPGEERSDAAAGIGAAQARLASAVTAMERELGQAAWPTGLMDLRPHASVLREVRFLFAAEPPASVLLIAVLDGRDAVDSRFPEALLASADVLRRVRAGRAPEAAAHRYRDARSFLEEFQPPAEG